MKEELKRATAQAHDAEMRYKRLEGDLPLRRAQLEEQGKALLEWRNKLQNAADEINEKIKTINEGLKKVNECETPEGRDKMRLLIAYKEAAFAENGYQKTAFNNGLAALFSGRCEA